MKIVGNGLIARQFAAKSSLFTNKKVLLFASGVADSAEVRDSQYQREVSSLLKHFDSDKKIVYFSSCSILDPSRQSSQYVQHKIQIEELLNQRGNSLIVRLPQVVGFNPNPTTLVQSIYLKLIGGQRIDVQARARRVLLDAQDVVRIVRQLLRKNDPEVATINIYSDHQLSVVDIISALEEATGFTARYSLRDSGSFACVDISILKAILGPGDPIFASTYGKTVLERYYKSRA